MRALAFTVAKNTLAYTQSTITTGNVEYIEAQLTLDADWSATGIVITPCYIYKGVNYQGTAITGESFYIDPAMIETSGLLSIALLGVVGDTTITTNYVTLWVIPGADYGEEIVLPTPSDLAALRTAIEGKQDTLTAGTNITITDNVISASGGGAVNSVNGEAGDVVLNAADVGADASGTAASAVAAHNSSATAHSTLFAGKAKYVDLGTDVTTHDILASNIFDAATDAATIYRGECSYNNYGETAWVFNTPYEAEETILRQVMLLGRIVYSRENWGTSWGAWSDGGAYYELVARKASSITEKNSTSTIFYPSVKATVDYIAAAITGAIEKDY